MDLSRITIGLRTFLRDQKLLNAISAIRDTMPEVDMIIADCGKSSPEKQKVYDNIIQQGHKVIHLSFDAGLGAMSNAVVETLQTPYVLIGSDDFSFRSPSVRKGIERMLEVLENTDVDVASGRVRGPYEFDLEEKDGVIIEHPVHIPLNPLPYYVQCDLTVNYSLFKKHVFQKVRWDEDIAIGGGEHWAVFNDIKKAGFKVAYIPGVSITEQEGEDSAEYKSYRARAASPARPCFVKRGIRRYVLGNGKVDWEAPDYYEPITR